MGTESSTGNAYGIADIHQLNQRIVFFADNVLTYIYLNTAGLILHIHEEEGAEKLNLIMVDKRIPAGARLH